jgi:hypothetical protein
MSRTSQATTTRTVDLDHQQLLLLEGRPGTRVKVIYGGIWLTHTGEADDLFACCEQEVALRARKRALLEGLGPTRVEVIEPARSDLAAAVALRLRPAWLATRDALITWIRSAQWSRGLLASAGLLVGVAVPTLVIVGMDSALLAGGLA